ncbi:indolepyruvate oxidoreductase subunit beta family protein [Breoghania sp. L-A4]|uniref:indolepyruvate oxidoreductase subunit beta family protein n=1 Tax=Breoghania sp. L-A4 TaxID=2304600 RepID=UPI000E360971|nr:indolepyruvate oxidoreductase subunit beta family protein [Breoghania sp. L-A4]AXS40378.1 indolepyruvate oxidoreductase subunit beta family protein [Breoghania sp. L-A4]
MTTTRFMIAALGGEGGGVLTNWIVGAAAAAGLKAQATSVPGVAQRTGATTYYIEVADEADSQGDPIFALMPVSGDVDVVVASELLEAVRMAERGYVAGDRTFLLASTHRVLTTNEKLTRGDGRADAAALMRAAEKGSRDRFLFDAAAIARAAGSPINAVLLGAVAALELLPIPREALRGAIEAGGIAVARNLKGFDAGYATAKGTTPEIAKTDAGAALPAPAVARSLDARIASMPEEARDVIRIGVARLVDYQNAAYANLYLSRLERFSDDPVLMREVARHLAVRMSFEDIIRVAQLKIRASRLERVRNDIRAEPGQPIELIDFFKPGIPELADMLPPHGAAPCLPGRTARASGTRRISA